MMKRHLETEAKVNVFAQKVLPSSSEKSLKDLVKTVYLHQVFVMKKKATSISPLPFGGC